MRCVIYTRVSTAEQGREGASLPVQLQACRKHAADQGWAVVDELQDIQSGLDVDRVAYQRVLELARGRSADVVLVWRLDRFGRDDGEAIMRLKDMAKLGVRVVSATEGEQSPFIQKMMFLLANEESRRTSDRVRPAMRKRVEEGLWVSKPPFGYAVVPGQPGHLQLDENAPLVREIFSRYLIGGTINGLAGWLNTLLTADGARRTSPTGRYFSRNFVRELLRNPCYIGMVRWNRRSQSKIDGNFKRPETEHILVPGQHEPLIDRETFDRAQVLLGASALHGRPNRERRLFLLTGLLVCGVCGRACCGTKNYTKTGNGHSYRCTHRHHGRHHGRLLDQMVLDAISAIPMPDNALDALRTVLARDEDGQPDRVTSLQVQRKRHEERRRRLTMFLADGTLEGGEYRAAVAEIEQAMATVDRELASLPAVAATAVLADVEAWVTMAREVGHGTVAAMLQGASLEDQAAAVSAAIERITLTRGTQPEITWRPWVARLREAALVVGEAGR
jgi:site-specific DNA recombinase